MTQISRNFTLEELCRSDKAVQKKISNTPNVQTVSRIKEAVECMLQPLRDSYGKDIKVTSGFRNEKVNSLAGGSRTSSHLYGYAFDMVPADGDMANFQQAVLKWSKFALFDQIIIEQPKNGIASWIHIGWRRGIDGSQREQILVAVKSGGKWAYRKYV